MDGSRNQGEFGALLRLYRDRARLTQQQLADFATLSVRAVRDLETGRAQRPRQDTVRLLADVLKLDGAQRVSFEDAGRGAAPGDLPGADLATPAPPLAAIAPPAPLTTILAREAELQVLIEMVLVDQQRLVTVVGVAGVGKTRLVQEVAATVTNVGGPPMLWVSAAELNPRELATRIGSRDALLVLDGAVWPSSAAPVLDLLHRCQGLRVVATAVAPSKIAGEQVFPLAPLPVPAPSDERDLVRFAQIGSVRLLTSQLRRVRPGFRLRAENTAVVADLCRWLDGIPRALEDAATWCLVHPPEQLLAQLRRDPFGLVPPADGGTATDLRTTLRRTLSEVEPALRFHLARLSSLDGGWTIAEAARATGGSHTELARAVHALLVHGAVRCTGETSGGRFSVLNQVRALHAEPAVRRPEMMGADPANAGPGRTTGRLPL